MKLQGERTITEERINQVVKEITDKTMHKGAGIRELFAGGLSVQDISKVTGIRYNHVYNVVKNEVVQHGLTTEIEKRDPANSKKATILALLAEGKTITEVSQMTRTLYNYVWQVSKNAKLTEAVAVATTTEVK